MILSRKWLINAPYTTFFISSSRQAWLTYNRCFCISHGNRSKLIDKDIEEQVKDIKYVFDLRHPGQFFSEARSLERKVIFHAGPTNSGKTHHALQRFLAAKTAIYCAPLRMLAGEVFRRSNQQGVECDLITGEERIYSVNGENPANHNACTVELCSITQHYEVAVIDEIQMLRDFDRGWAWTRALLGVPAREIHVCGEPSAIEIVESLLEKNNESLEVINYNRLTPLKVLDRNINIKRLQKGDCVIAFSQKNIYELRKFIERVTSKKCAVIYGNLPANVRFDQAEQFNKGLCDILIASDAIGMGMNLNIRRIVFSSLKKFDGNHFCYLTPHHMKQIAGRAGRYGSKFEVGFVSTIDSLDMKNLQEILSRSNAPIKKAGILPSYAQLELLSMALPGKSLLGLLDVFELLMQLDKDYFLCDVERLKIVAQKIEDIPLKLNESYIFSIAPVNILKSSFVLACMKEFAWSVSFDSVVDDKKVRQIVRWPPRARPKTLRSLQHLEFIHEVFDLYRWLSFRFPSHFNDYVKVVGLQEELESLISQAVDANLKNYSQEASKIRTYVKKRKRRR